MTHSVIDKSHRDFAQALVALAREHNMNNLQVSFRKSFHHPEGDFSSEPVEMSWSEGRHLSEGRISLTVRSSISERLDCGAR